MTNSTKNTTGRFALETTLTMLYVTTKIGVKLASNLTKTVIDTARFATSVIEEYKVTVNATNTTDDIAGDYDEVIFKARGINLNDDEEDEEDPAVCSDESTDTETIDDEDDIESNKTTSFIKRLRYAAIISSKVVIVLGYNLYVAVVDTVKYAFKEVVKASSNIRESFNRNFCMQ